MITKQNYYLFSGGKLCRREHSLLLDKTEPAEGAKPPSHGHLQTAVLAQDDEECSKLFEPRVHIPVESIGALLCFSEVTFTAATLRYLAKKNIPVHFFDYYGNLAGVFYPREEMVAGDLVLEQAKHHLDPERRLAIARAFVGGALANMEMVLAYYERRGAPCGEQRIAAREMAAKAATAESIEALMGNEGYGKRRYFEAWPLLLKRATFTGRTMHPPGDPVNAAISFLNALLYSVCVTELYRCGLHPMISFTHEPRERRFSLSLDIADLFKPVITDRLVFTLFNKEILDEKTDFEARDGGVYLAGAGRKKVVEQFDSRMKTTFLCERLGRNISYRQLILRECQALAAHLRGEATYEPYLSRW